MKLENYLKLLDYFSLITVTKDKIPNFKWKEQQVRKLSPEEFTKRYNSPSTNNVGIVTGFEDLEVVDVDLKVFSTTREKEEFWEEYLKLLKDTIFDFDEKFVIYKTKNAGYHILYKTKRVGGNQKLSKLKHHDEYLIETRGKGGYVFVYPENKISKLSYFDVKYISDDDWIDLMRISKSYNYIEPKKEEVDVKIKKTYNHNGVTPWDDFNAQIDVWDVVQDDFTIYRDTPKKIMIKRHNAKSLHSGYIYKEDNLMYLFSTGTIYPHETQISPYYAYTIKYHNGDFSASAKDLYNQGFGDRLTSDIKEKESKVPDKTEEIDAYLINEKDLVFPIDIFPKPYQNYIMECHRVLDSVIDYMGCALLWVASICIGNSVHVKVKNRWIDPAILWVAIVGKAGVGKTPSISNITFPLEKENQKKIQKYFEDYDLYEAYSSLSHKEKETVKEVHKPIKKQFIVGDITLEALADLHESSDNAIGNEKDELKGWLNDMNKYRAGSDLQFWLSTWSGKSVNINRMTRRGTFISNPFISVMGGIQPNVLNSISTEENKDSGFLDRLLLSYPDVEPEYFNENDISQDAVDWYRDSIVNFYNTFQRNIQRDEKGKIKPMLAVFDEDAKKALKKGINNLVDKMRSDSENEYVKSIYPKQQTYIPRFALIIHALDCVTNDAGLVKLISKESVEKAIRLSNYFIATAKKVKRDSTELGDMKTTLSFAKGKTNFEKFKAVYLKNPKINKQQLADIIGVSVQMIYNYIKKIEK